MFDTCTLDIMRSAVFNGMHMPSSWLHQSCDSLAHSVFLHARFCQPFSPPPPSPRLCWFFSTVVFSVTGSCSFLFVWGLMAGLRCCVSHGGITSTKVLAANSGSPWILQAPNPHFSDAVVNM